MTSRQERDDAMEALLKRAPMRDGGSPSIAACPDPEVMAAWIEDRLSSTERTSTEAHTADCPRCQAVLAALVRSTPAPSPRRTFWSAPVRWLAPAAAVATAAALWIAVDSRDVTRPQVEPVPDFAATEPRPAPPAAEPSEAVSGSAAAAAPPPQPRQRRELARKLDAPAETRSARAAAQDAGTPASRSLAALEERVHDRSTGLQKTTVPPAAPTTVVSTPAPVAADALEMQAFALRTSSGREIISPDRTYRWRLDAPSAVSRSTDGGKTWVYQPTGATEPLLAGSSPGTAVCWLVGRNGVVLLTTDGATWRRLPFPESIDLIAVAASSIDDATVTTADGRSFATADRGASWIPR